MNKHSKYMKSSKGFALIELCLSLSVMGIIYALGVASMNINAFTQTSVISKYLADMSVFELAVSNYKFEKNSMPTDNGNGNFIDELSPGYLFAPVAPDGFDKSYGINGYLLYSNNSRIYICAKVNLNKILAETIQNIEAKLSSSKFYYNLVCPQTSSGSLQQGSTIYLSYYIQ